MVAQMDDGSLKSIDHPPQLPAGPLSIFTRAFQRYVGRGAVRVALERYVSKQNCIMAEYWQRTVVAV